MKLGLSIGIILVCGMAIYSQNYTLEDMVYISNINQSIFYKSVDTLNQTYTKRGAYRVNKVPETILVLLRRALRQYRYTVGDTYVAYINNSTNKYIIYIYIVDNNHAYEFAVWTYTRR